MAERTRAPLLVGNWKMHGRAADLEKLRSLAATLGDAPLEIVMCPPTHLLSAAVQAVGESSIAIGAQDCASCGEDGARTGDISAAMLADIGVRYVIVGHSERRMLHAETDALVRDKAQSVLAAGLTPIICVGESLAERQAGRTGSTLAAQVLGSTPEAASRHIIIAYEPVWCIGAARTPTQNQIVEALTIIRTALAHGARTSARILYGGAVGPANAAELFAIPGIDGVLVGRSSLQIDGLLGIAAAYSTR